MAVTPKGLRLHYPDRWGKYPDRWGKLRHFSLLISVASEETAGNGGLYVI